MKKLLIASTSAVCGQSYLSYLLPEISKLFDRVDEVLFIPYAQPGGISYENYTRNAQKAFRGIGKQLKGIHEFENAREAVKNAQGIFVGGGNTFLLVKTLYENDAMSALKFEVEQGTPYLGTSAGSNITGVTMQNTNDMPIVFPQSFDTMRLIDFNINAHYLDPDPDSTFMGETRETRIREFHKLNAIPVLGLREGSWLEVSANKVLLKGKFFARLFQQNKEALEIEPGTDLSFLR